MFEQADRLVGIYKTYNATKSVTINPKKVGNQLTLTPAESDTTSADKTPLGAPASTSTNIPESETTSQD